MTIISNDTAKHVEHFSALGIDYLSRLHQLNIVSGSILSYFFYVGMTYGFANTNRVLGYDSYYRKSHGASFTRALAHLVKVKRTNKTAIYDNAKMAESLVYLFGSEFTETKLSVLNPNIRFISYCLESESEIYISSRSYPDMSFGDLVRACVSVPAIYGEFRYNDHRCIDPVFSGKFKQIRKRLLQGPEQHLYLNHKLTHRSSNRHYVSTEDKRFSELRMTADFVRYYFGLPNPRVVRTNKKAVEHVKPDLRITSASMTIKDIFSLTQNCP